MANWWEAAPLVEEPAQAGNWWEAAPLVEEKPATAPAFSGSLLPFSRDAQGNVSFDSNAGILGAAKRAFMLPGDAMAGKVDPTSDEGIGRALEFASVFSPPTPGIRSGDMMIPGERRAVQKTVPRAPTTDDLYTEAGRNFDAMRESGVDYLADAVKNFARTAKARMEAEGFDAEVAGKTHRILDKLSNPPEGSVANIRGLHSARKTFGKIAQNFNDPTDQSAASQAIRGLDEFISAADPSSVVAGTPSEAARLLQSGNANYAAAKRSDLLTGIERTADLRASAANSGANTGNAIRQRVASALDQPKKVSGFSAEEIAALEGIVSGSPGQNVTRRIGNLLGGGGGLGQAVTTFMGAAAGGSIGGGVGAGLGAMLPAVVGTTSKGLSNKLTRGALRSADEMVRMRAPLYEAMKSAAPMEVSRQAAREAIIRALLADGSNSGGGW